MKNPWSNNNDDMTVLSPQERSYRQSENKKLRSAVLMVLGCIFAYIIVLVLSLQRMINGGSLQASDWIYTIPSIGALAFILYQFKRK